jgi:CDP-glycerol glycerophosphotransferase
MDHGVPPAPGDRDATAGACVSVIVPVWNVEPWLRECLHSVVSQTIGLDRLEVIAVDDGSTDGSGHILDEYAARYPAVTVVHEPNSGGPGRPRNVGLDRASGRYVFFLDADDFLGVEALERLVAMAERNASDIVLGKIVGIGGRKVYRAVGVFARSVDRADLEQVYQSSNVLKLFRRSFLERVGLRFPEGIAGGEDGDFMARVYLEATTISVVADYDCYFTRRRPGSQTTRKDRNDDLGEYIARLERDRIRPVAARRRPGPERDMLLRKHIRKLSRKFGRGWRVLEPDERRRVFDIGSAVVRRWHNERIQRAMPAREAIRVHCLQHGLLAELEDIVACPSSVAFGDPIVERGRIYARYPHFRDGSGIPDSCFDITREVVADQRLTRAEVSAGVLHLTGEAYLRLIGGATTVELRRWPRGATWRFAAPSAPTPTLRDPAVSYPRAGFDIAIDLSTAAGGRPLPTGTWRILLAVGTDGIRRIVPLQAPRRPPADWAAGGGVGGIDHAGLYATRAREVRLRVGKPGRAMMWLERAEAAGSRIRRGIDRVLSSSLGGRLRRAIR